MQKQNAGLLGEMLVKFFVSLISMLILLTVVSAQNDINGPRLGIVNGKAIYLPKPDYPQEAKDFCAGGKVEIEVLISEKGDVIEAKPISGDELLHNTSVQAVKKAKFGPMADSIPLKSKGIVVYNFVPQPKCIVVGIVNKRALKIPKPYINLSPPKKEALMVVQIVVNMEGRVTAARAVSGNPLIRSACENAARQTKFSPALIDGRPIKVKAFLVYKFKPDGTIDTDIERNDKAVIGTPIKLIEPPKSFCNCKFGKNPNVLVEAKIDEQGNVINAKARSGHPILRNICEKAALESKFLPTNIKARISIVYHFETVDEKGMDVKIKNIEVKEAKIDK